MMKNKLEKLFLCIISLVVITSFSLAPLSMRGIRESVDSTPFSFSNLSTQDIFWPSNSSDWTEVTPEEQGLDSDKIAELFEYIEIRGFDIRSVIIVRNGYLLLEQYFSNSHLIENKSYPGGIKIHDQWSTTKSLMSILIGIALQEGFLDNISQTLYEFFADIWEPGFVDGDVKKNITIEQLLTMNSGLNGGGPGYPSDAETKLAADSIKFALEEVPLIFTPGEAGEFEYSNDGPTLLSGIIANVTGNSTEEFAKEYLFDSLGISEDEYYWTNDSKGIDWGGYGFACSPKVQAKLGILCLNNGTWNGTQIVEKNYLKDATSHQVDGDWPPNSYGYLFWIQGGLIDGYFSYGAAGQCIYIIPEYNLTVGFAGIFFGDYRVFLQSYILKFAEDNAPEWDQIPEDQTILEGESFYYDVNASDTSGVEYSINDTTNFNLTPEGIITNASSLSADDYPLELRAYNPFNNNITVTINIIVESIPSSNAIPGFDFTMMLIMILCTSYLLIIRRKKIFKN